MHTRWLIALAALLLTGANTPAADSIFDFSDLDVEETTPAEKDADADSPRPAPEDDPLSSIPESIRTILDKLERFASTKRTSLMKEIADGRKIASEILVKNATNTDAATRTALLDEAKRIEGLPPEQPLLVTTTAKPAPAAASSAFALPVGTWKKVNNKKWTNTLAADGGIVRFNGSTGTWRWVDEKRGVFVFDYSPKNSNAELVQIDLKSKPLKATVRTEWGQIFTIVKTEPADKPAVPVPTAGTGTNKLRPPVEPVVKLAAHESNRRKETETLIQTKNTKVAAWLLQEARALPAAQARLVVERASELEGKPVAPATTKDALGEFAGVWIYAGKKLEFSPDGTIKINSARAGRWIWPRANTRSLIALTFETGNTGYYGRLSKSREGILHLIPAGSKPSEAKRG